MIKRKLEFENYKNYLEAIQLENKINYLERNKIDRDSLKNNPKQFIKTINQYKKHSESLKVKGIMFLLKKLIKLL